MLFCDPAMIKDLTLEDAQRLIGDGKTAEEAFIMTHTSNSITLSGIIVIRIVPNGQDFKCAPLTDVFKLKSDKDEFPVRLKLEGNTLRLEIKERHFQFRANESSHTF